MFSVTQNCILTVTVAAGSLEIPKKIYFSALNEGCHVPGTFYEPHKVRISVQ